MSPAMIGVIGIVVLVLLLFSRMPVGFVMALVGVVGFGFLVSFNAAFNLMVKDIFSVFGSYSLTVVPLFILMGQIAFHSGISSRLFDVAYKFMGHWPGGLAIATIGACTGFAAICGSTNATAATMAAVTLPEMKKYRYNDKIATGVVAAGGSLGILVPPSVIFIIFGVNKPGAETPINTSFRLITSANAPFSLRLLVTSETSSLYSFIFSFLPL